MKKIKLFMMSFAAVCALGMSSCVKDLEVTPIDPSTRFPSDALNSEQGFEQLLAKCYAGLAVSSSYGANGDPDIEGVDGGFGQYLRAYFNLNCLTTDEAICAWNDTGLPDLQNMNWQSSNQFIIAMYYRVFYQISLCNEFIRQANSTNVVFTGNNRAAMIAEARALRALSFYHAIDMFGDVAFPSENDPVSLTAPRKISRAELFDWVVAECEDLVNGSDLAEEGQNIYGRCDKGFARMILAKLYLNAEVYKGEAMYDKCAEQCEILMSKYQLHPNFADLFAADNHLFTANTTHGSTNEIIFAVPHDGIRTTSYGGTNFLIFAGTGGDMNPTEMGISSGWSGLTVTKQVADRYTENDARHMFFTAYGKENPEAQNFTAGGYKSIKFRNVNHDGGAAQTTGFVDTDFPLFRVADAYLMLAECAKRGGADEAKGLKALNDVRTRANAVAATSYTLQDVLDERSREFLWEGCRRQDLIRYGQFTTADYVWEYKGSVKEGAAVESFRNLFPIPAAEINANPNLSQNEGY